MEAILWIFVGVLLGICVLAGLILWVVIYRARIKLPKWTNPQVNDFPKP
jgi:hypothetical protein